MNKTSDIPIEFLHECFIYDPETGILTWKERPPKHFLHSKGPNEHARFNTRYAGKQVGTPNRGYLQTRLHHNGIRYTTVNVHRICIAMMTGKWPPEDTDHDNGIHDDNRWINIKPATRAENQLNQNNKLYKNNKSGYRGVYKHHNKWKSIRSSTNQFTFDTPEEASKAYLDAISKLWPK